MDDGGSPVAVLTVAVLSTIRTVAETGSTNADMLALARGGIEEGVWLRAGRQTAGRGRLGRTWVSPVGNFYASTVVLLRSTDPAAATLALVAAVSLHETVSTYLQTSTSPFAAFGGSSFSRWEREGGAPRRKGEGDGLALKWPNDLLLKGEKLSGILLERADDAVVIGVGVNLAHHPDLPDRPTTSLAAHGVAVAPDDFADTLAEAFARWLGRLRGEGLAPVRARWLARAHPVGTALTARLPDGDRVDGLFDGLDTDGALMLRLASGERRVIHAADVFLL